MPSKFLGKGLNDLNKEMGVIPDISVLTGGERVVIKQIPIFQINPNPNQPRRTFTQTELEDLTKSIKEKGVLVPIIIRPVQNKNYLYEIVAGERRWRASQLAGLSEIPAVVKTLNDKNAMEIALIENVQRENLNPIEEGDGYKNLIDNGYSLEDISKLIGKSDSYIKNLIRITTLPDTVKDLVKNGKISASHARTIAVSENPELLAREILSKNLSVADTQKIANQTNRAKASKKHISTHLDDSFLSKTEQKLSSVLQTVVKIKEKRGGSGEIIIKYPNRVKMDKLIEFITKK
ncbi:MAG: ParB/RepB/Spo0J family partition protein [Alphaproteobacteria bacterium]|nr:ParB/RepB/Spo0J family partition protein [Alphaproteobacteria bacterium]